MTREELVDMMLSTRTREEVIETQEAISAWMEKHPDDQGIMDGAEMVAMLASAYGIENQEEKEWIRQYILLHGKHPDHDDTEEH